MTDAPEAAPREATEAPRPVGSDALERLLAAFPDAEGGVSADGILFVRLPVDRLAEAAALLADELGYERFIDLTAVDHPERDDRFELQYLVYSMGAAAWLRLKARTSGEAPSVTGHLPGANWYEREVYDLFGVVFQGHPDLTRIMLPDDWQGHPLRRDHPTGGEPVDFVATREIYGT